MKNLLKSSALFFALFVCVLMNQSCEMEQQMDNPEGLAAPKLPTTEMFMLPVAKFEGAEDLDGKTNDGTFANFVHAGVNLLVWHTAVVLNMAAPTAALAGAFNQDAEYIGNSTFEWAYDYQAPPNLGGQNFNIALSGQYVNATGEVKWIMRASQVGGFSDFIWFEGQTTSDGKSAAITVNAHPNNPAPVFEIDYDKTNGDQQVLLRFTNAIPGDAANGNYVEYRADNTANLNRAFDGSGREPARNSIQ